MPVRTTVALGLICFAAVEAFIIFPMLGKPHKDLDYLVVLGAQVKGETVSNSLRLRLDEALDYLEENPRTRVVVTGGKGPGEDISEAAAATGSVHELSASDVIGEVIDANVEGGSVSFGVEPGYRYALEVFFEQGVATYVFTVH